MYREMSNKLDEATNASATPTTFITEVYLRQVNIMVTPLMEFYPALKIQMPFTVYISRMATIGELQCKVVQSLKQIATE